MNGIIALGAAGGGVASAAAGRVIVSGQGGLTPEKLKEIFLAVYPKGDSEVKVMQDAHKVDI